MSITSARAGRQVQRPKAFRQLSAVSVQFQSERLSIRICHVVGISTHFVCPLCSPAWDVESARCQCRRPGNGESPICHGRRDLQFVPVRTQRGGSLPETQAARPADRERRKIRRAPQQLDVRGSNCSLGVLRRSGVLDHLNGWRIRNVVREACLAGPNATTRERGLAVESGRDLLQFRFYEKENRGCGVDELLLLKCPPSGYSISGCGEYPPHSRLSDREGSTRLGEKIP